MQPCNTIFDDSSFSLQEKSKYLVYCPRTSNILLPYLRRWYLDSVTEVCFTDKLVDSDEAKEVKEGLDELKKAKLFCLKHATDHVYKG